MYASEIFFDRDVPTRVKEGFIELIERENLGSDVLLLKPTSSNDDTNGSQHGRGGTDFTYEDATPADLVEASSLGYYDYFADYGTGYTGHSYQGEGYRFGAIVIDPPAYAATVQV